MTELELGNTLRARWACLTGPDEIAINAEDAWEDAANEVSRHGLATGARVGDRFVVPGLQIFGRLFMAEPGLLVIAHGQGKPVRVWDLRRERPEDLPIRVRFSNLVVAARPGVIVAVVDKDAVVVYDLRARRMLRQFTLDLGEPVVVASIAAIGPSSLVVSAFAAAHEEGPVILKRCHMGVVDLESGAVRAQRSSPARAPPQLYPAGHGRVAFFRTDVLGDTTTLVSWEPLGPGSELRTLGETEHEHMTVHWVAQHTLLVLRADGRATFYDLTGTDPSLERTLCPGARALRFAGVRGHRLLLLDARTDDRGHLRNTLVTVSLADTPGFRPERAFADDGVVIAAYDRPARG